VQKVVAQKVDLSEADVESRLQTLVSLLPDIPARLPSMKPEIVARLLNEVKELGLMSEPIESLQQRAGALRAFLPTVDIDRLVQVLLLQAVLRMWASCVEMLLWQLQDCQIFSTIELLMWPASRNA